MPEYYDDWWWEDLPPRARKHAEFLGYSQTTWDDDSKVAYDKKSFDQCSVAEKRSARYLGYDPIDEKLDIWWDDTDSDTQAFAKVLGWDKSKWDDDWEIYDLPCEHWNWKDMTDEQKDAAMHFGYSRALWDETDEDDDEEFGFMAASVKPPKKSSSKPQQEEKEEEGDFESSEDEATPAASKPSKTKPAKSKQKIVVSRSFGGSGGTDFDHMNNRKISQITIWADSHCVNSLAVKYVGSVKKAGENTGGDEKSLTLKPGEYVTSVTIRANNLVQCLTFKTNKGVTLGPCGGKGWPKARLGRDHEGKEETLMAPKGGYMLCGIMGGAGAHLDRIAFRWGPVPASMQS